MTKKKKRKPVPINKRLIKAIGEKGLKKSKIAERLNMTRPTLDTRLRDGKFTTWEKEEIRKLYL